MPLYLVFVESQYPIECDCIICVCALQFDVSSQAITGKANLRDARSIEVENVQSMAAYRKIWGPMTKLTKIKHLMVQAAPNFFVQPAHKALDKMKKTPSDKAMYAG